MLNSHLNFTKLREFRKLSFVGFTLLANFSLGMLSHKSQIRKSMKSNLKTLDPDTLRQASEGVMRNVMNQNLLERCNCPSIYLSMPTGEMDTSPLVSAILREKVRFYTPKVIGPNSEDMVMFEVKDMETIHSFPKSKWGIPEPILPEGGVSIDSYGEIDLVFVPGVAFDSGCRRLGHGKGYYGKE